MDRSRLSRVLARNRLLGAPRWWTRGRRGPRQRSFAFIERALRLERKFKRAILGLTTALVLVAAAGTSNGRYHAGQAMVRTRRAALGAIGLPPSRSEIDADWSRKRQHDMEQTRGKLASVYAEYAPPMRRLLDVAGLSPEQALLRWGNFDKTLYLPSTVFEPDDTGRSYRFRPKVRSVWVRNLKLKGGVLAYFPVPVTPELDDLAREAGAVIVAASVQTTNSWGLRGPEPDLSAPLKGIVLGDSYMQGLFVGDDETPVECLKRELSRSLGERTEILNTGHMGYSPEQEYYTLREYVERFQPSFVVLSLFANDFGDLFEVLEGKGDWEESRYWLRQIAQLCRTKGLECLVVPAPWVNQFEGPRRSGFYPGLASNILECTGTTYLDPIDAFADELLKLKLGEQADGRRNEPNPLFNGKLGDGHFSALGCRLWARCVAERVRLLFEKDRIDG